MGQPVIIDAIRSPFGRRGGAFRELRPDALLASILERLTERTGIEPQKIDEVIAGCVTQAGEQGANLARQAALLSGLPLEIPAFSLNRMCGSGQTAVHIAAQAVAAGDARYAIGCGVESMSRVPMFCDVSPGAAFQDWSGLNPELLSRYEMLHQGRSAELVAAKWRLGRETLDGFAKESHRRAHEAATAGRNVEIVPLQGVGADGSPVTVSADEGIRPVVDEARMRALEPVFQPQGGVVTAGNASQMSDGAAALLIADSNAARADGLQPRARFRARVSVGSDPAMQLDGVIPATRKALARSGLDLSDVDWIEINEAFACVPLAWSREFGIDPARLNPWGGAIAHGHPLGATGAGLVAKALAGLEQSDGTIGLTVFCVGHGMSTATIIERI